MIREQNNRIKLHSYKSVRPSSSPPPLTLTFMKAFIKAPGYANANGTTSSRLQSTRRMKGAKKSKTWHLEAASTKAVWWRRPEGGGAKQFTHCTEFLSDCERAGPGGVGRGGGCGEGWGVLGGAFPHESECHQQGALPSDPCGVGVGGWRWRWWKAL